MSIIILSKKFTILQVFSFILELTILITSFYTLFTQPQIQPQLIDSNNPKIIRVMSYNIQQAYNPEGISELGKVINTIRNVTPDLIGLEECGPTRLLSENVNPLYTIANELGYYIYIGPDPQEQTPGVCILSKFPIKLSNYAIISTSDFPRAIAYVEVNISGELVDFYTVHTNPISATERINQVNNLLTFINNTSSAIIPRIVVGDFNDLPNSTIYQDMITAGYHDAWTSAGNPINSSSGYTWNSYTPDQRIDYIFLSNTPNIQVLSFNVLTHQYGSDHLPILSDIKLP